MIGSRLRVHPMIEIGILMALMLAFSQAKAASSAPPCNSSKARTLASSGQIRIFRFPAQGKQGPVFTCRRPDGKSWRLGPSPEKGWSAAVPGPFAIKNQWAGGVERRQVGQDTVELFSAARNAISGGSRAHCLIGGADRPEQLPDVLRLFSAPDGSIVWVVQARHGTATNQIAVCEDSGTKVIAEGPGVQAQSVTLTNFVLTWHDETGKHSLTLK